MPNAVPFDYSLPGAPSFTNIAINSAGGSIDRMAWLLQMPEAATITKILLRYGVRTGTPVAHDIGLQGLTATATPDGTWKGGGSPNKVSFTPPADATWDGTIRRLTLDNPYSAARGEILCIVLEPTGTPDGSNNSTFTRTLGGAFGFPRCLTQTDGGAWAFNGTVPNIAVESATTVYGFPVLGNWSTNIGTNGHRQTNKIVLPASWGASYKVVGVKIVISLNADVIIGIWDSSGSVISAVQLDGDLFGGQECRVYFDDTPSAQLFGSAYYFGVERVTSPQRPAGFTVDAANDMTAFALDDKCIASDWNGSSWTDAPTRRYLVMPILEEITGGGVRLIGNGRGLAA